MVGGRANTSGGPALTRDDVLAFRVRAHQLDQERTAPADAAILDVGAQDTGPDGGRWALAVRGIDLAALGGAELATVWTVRAAPHLYRRADLPAIATATAPFSEADAAKRVFDAARPLKAAGISLLTALDTVAAAMGALVTEPMSKGDLSTLLTARLDQPYLRECRPCQAVHIYEQPLRLAALRAGLELQPGTSPPVLQPIPGYAGPLGAAALPARFEVIRGYLRLFGPATPQHVAQFLDSPVREVRAHWPADAVEVTVDGAPRWMLAADVDALTRDPAPRTVRLLGPYDLYLQARDRPLLVNDPTRARALWPVLGRPGAVLVDGEIAALWRPRTSGRRLRLHLTPWQPLTSDLRTALTVQAEHLAAHRKVTFAGLDLDT